MTMSSNILFVLLLPVVLTQPQRFTHTKSMVVKNAPDGLYDVRYVPSYRSSYSEDGNFKTHQFVASVPLIVKASPTVRPPTLIPTSPDRINLVMIDCKFPPCNNIISVKTSPTDSFKDNFPTTSSYSTSKDNRPHQSTSFTTSGLGSKYTFKSKPGNSGGIYGTFWNTKRPFQASFQGTKTKVEYPTQQFSDSIRRPSIYNYDHSFSYEPKGSDISVMTHQHSWHNDNFHADRNDRPGLPQRIKWGTKIQLNDYNWDNRQKYQSNRWGITNGDSSTLGATKRPSWGEKITSHRPERPWYSQTSSITPSDNSTTNIIE